MTVDREGLVAPATARSVQILRWIAVLPAAVLASWIAWILIAVVGRLFSGVDAESFIGKLWYISIGHAAFGAAFVYFGALVAPAHRKPTAYALAGVGLVLLGFMLFPAVWGGDGWAIWGGICAAIGIGAVTYNIHNNETEIV